MNQVVVGNKPPSCIGIYVVSIALANLDDVVLNKDALVPKLIYAEKHRQHPAYPQLE